MDAVRPGRDAPPSLALGALHLFVLSSLGLAQPLLDVLARAPEFFLAQRLGRREILLTVAIACLLVPGLLTAIEGLLPTRLRVIVHRIFVALLAVPVALLIFQRIPGLSGTMQLAAAAALAAALAFAYARRVEVRSFVSLLSPAIVVVPGLFVFASQMTDAMRAAPRPVSTGTPSPYDVVMVVFDEFPVSSLLDADYEIDAARYPNLAALSREATWFRNATSVADVTQGAVAALLTGRYPDLNPLSDPATRSSNLFTLLAASHALDVRESYVPFCPTDLCPEKAADVRKRWAMMFRDLGVVLLHVLAPAELRGGLPDVSVPMLLLRKDQHPGALDARIVAAQQSLRDADPTYRGSLLEEFIDGVGTGATPALHYLHVLLPHEPSLHLPSGRMCEPVARREPIIWAHEGAARRAQLRHLLQVEFVDAFVGRLVAKLKTAGRWDSTILVLTGDHGVSFRPGHPRRPISPGNVCDIIAVPLLIRMPGGEAGTTDVNAESVDVLPTILDLLGVSAPWPMDGHALSLGEGNRRNEKKVIGPYWGPLEKEFFPSGGPTSIGGELDRNCLDVERKIELFGSGSDRARLYAPEPFAALIGRPSADVARAPANPNVRAQLESPEDFEQMDEHAPFVPCTIRARIEGAGDGERHVAIAVNGIVRAVTPIERTQSGETHVVATVDDAAFAAGPNAIQMFLVEQSTQGLALSEIADPARARTLSADRALR